MAKNRTHSDGIFPLLAFVLSVGGLSYIYGAVSHRYDLFPVQFLKEAKAGYDAWRKKDNPALLDVHLSFVTDVPKQLTNWLSLKYDSNDLILVAGGFEQHPEICPRFGCLAYVMDHEGQVLHKWEVDPETVFEPDDLAEFSSNATMDNVIVQGVAMTNDGGLVVTFQGKNIFPYHVGSMGIDKDGQVLWKSANHAHHWPLIAENGEIILPWSRLEQPPEPLIGGSSIDTNCTESYNAVYEEGFQMLDQSGTVIRQIGFEELLEKNGLLGLSYSVRDGCDPYHINGLAELNEAVAAKIPGAESGDLVISLRSSSTLIIVDRTDDVIHHVFSGPMVAQHSPVVRPQGDILVFDNLGGAAKQGGSRILSIDPVSGLGTTLYPRPDDVESSLLSRAQGVVRVSQDGTRALVSETESGRLLEIDLETGQALWAYTNITELSLLNAHSGGRLEADFALIETRGASFLPRERFSSVFGNAKVLGQVGPT